MANLRIHILVVVVGFLLTCVVRAHPTEVGVIFFASSEAPERIKGIEPSHYLTVYANAMSLDWSKRYWRRYFASVRSYMTLVDPETRERKMVTYVGQPNVFQQKHTSDSERILLFNERLLGPTPYLGGGLEMDVGLVKARLADEELSQPFFKLLSAVSSLTGVSLPSRSNEYSVALKQGIENALGVRDNILQVSYSTFLESPRPGIYILYKRHGDGVAPTQADFDQVLDSWLDPTDKNPPRVVQASPEGPLGEASLLVLTVKLSKRRDDWQSLPGIRGPLVALEQKRASWGKKPGEVAKAAHENFKKAVAASPHLIPSQRAEILKAVKDAFEGKKTQ